jgi:anthranilate synthase component 2
MIVLIDNYDSFSYNLFQLAGAVNRELHPELAGAAGSRPEGKQTGSEPDASLTAGILVIRNDTYTAEEIGALHPEAIILSPGPGRPEDAGVCVDVVKKLAGKVPILGVCLGHQAICQAFGGTVTYAKELMHGKQSEITFEENSALFQGLTGRIKVARYHSLSAAADTLPEELRVTAWSDDGEVMAVEHSRYPVFGVQFHPESVMTPDGYQMIKNFLRQH